MIIYRHTTPEETPLCAQGSVVTIGNFDGVHKGHQAVLSAAKSSAKDLGVPLVVLTFEPHPRAVLTPEKAPVQLTAFDEKCTLLKRYGADAVYAIDFTKAYAATSAKEFVEETLVKTLRAKRVVVGYDFHFGRGREGSAEMLAEMGHGLGYNFTALQAQKTAENALVYSSTEVRKALADADFELAENLLGHKLEIFKTYLPSHA